MRVLIVDDDADLREVLEEILTSEGYEVATSRDGGEALEALRRQRFDLVLLDLNMPRVSGWEFRALQKADPALAAVPVAVMSAGEIRDIEAAAYVAKPFEIAALLAVVRRCVAPDPRRAAGERT